MVFFRVFSLAFLAFVWWGATQPLRRGYLFFTTMKGSRVDRETDPWLFWPGAIAAIAFGVFATWRIVVDLWL